MVVLPLTLTLSLFDLEDEEEEEEEEDEEGEEVSATRADMMAWAIRALILSCGIVAVPIVVAVSAAVAAVPSPATDAEEALDVMMTSARARAQARVGIWNNMFFLLLFVLN